MSKPLEWRIQQLRGIRQLLTEHADTFCKAVYADLRKVKTIIKLHFLISFPFLDLINFCCLIFRSLTYVFITVLYTKITCYKSLHCYNLVLCFLCV